MTDTGSLLLPAAPKAQRLASPPAARTLREMVEEAVAAWLARSTSADTRNNYKRDLTQFLVFVGAGFDRPEVLIGVRPAQVSAWRDLLLAAGMANSSVGRKLSVLRSLYSYLRSYGYTGANPAHPDLVASPKVPRDGKTVALSPSDCRRLLDGPDGATPDGIRDRAILAVLAYSGVRVGEVTRLKVGSYKTSGVHRILDVLGKGGKERRVPVHLEAAERLDAWLELAKIREDGDGALFRPWKSPHVKEVAPRPMTRRTVQRMVECWVDRLGLDPNVTVHSLRATALTTARDAGCDLVEIQDFAGHTDPKTTLAYIRNRDRLHKSPAYVLKY